MTSYIIQIVTLTVFLILVILNQDTFFKNTKRTLLLINSFAILNIAINIYKISIGQKIFDYFSSQKYLSLGMLETALSISIIALCFVLLVSIIRNKKRISNKAALIIGLDFIFVLVFSMAFSHTVNFEYLKDTSIHSASEVMNIDNKKMTDDEEAVTLLNEIIKYSSNKDILEIMETLYSSENIQIENLGVKKMYSVGQKVFFKDAYLVPNVNIFDKRKDNRFIEPIDGEYYIIELMYFNIKDNIILKCNTIILYSKSVNTENLIEVNAIYMHTFEEEIRASRACISFPSLLIKYNFIQEIN